MFCVIPSDWMLHTTWRTSRWRHRSDFLGSCRRRHVRYDRRKKKSSIPSLCHKVRCFVIQAGISRNGQLRHILSARFNSCRVIDRPLSTQSWITQELPSPSAATSKGVVKMRRQPHADGIICRCFGVARLSIRVRRLVRDSWTTSEWKRDLCTRCMVRRAHVLQYARQVVRSHKSKSYF